MAPKMVRLCIVFLLSILIVALIILGLEMYLWAGQATLTWNAPTTNTDGSTLTDLSSFNVYQGTATGVYTIVGSVGSATTTYSATNLTPATYYFAVTAVNSIGAESSYSNEGSKTIAANNAVLKASTRVVMKTSSRTVRK